jgi:flagellar protein FliL
LPAACDFTQAGTEMAATTEAKPAAEQPEVEGDDTAQAPGKKSWIPKLSRKIMIVIGGALILVGAAGGGAYFFFGHSKADAVAANQVKPPVFMDMPDVLVNLSSSGNGERTQYLKVKVVLELPDDKVMAQIQPLIPRLLDTFQTYLRELRSTDLDGSAGLYRLKEELTRRVNAAIVPNRVNAVLFKEIVVQ